MMKFTNRTAEVEPQDEAIRAETMITLVRGLTSKTDAGAASRFRAMWRRRPPCGLRAAGHARA